MCAEWQHCYPFEGDVISFISFPKFFAVFGLRHAADHGKSGTCTVWRGLCSWSHANLFGCRCLVYDFPGSFWSERLVPGGEDGVIDWLPSFSHLLLNLWQKTTQSKRSHASLSEISFCCTSIFDVMSCFGVHLVIVVCFVCCDLFEPSETLISYDLSFFRLADWIGL